MGRGAAGVNTNGSVTKFRGSRLGFAGAAGSQMAFGVGTDYAKVTDGCTVIVKHRILGTNGATGSEETLASCIAGTSPNRTGWLLWNVQNTFANTGYNFLIATPAGGDFWYVTAAVSASAVDMVVAGVYDKQANLPRIYINGTEMASGRTSSSGTPSSVNWQVWGSGTLKIGNNSANDIPLNGDVMWMAMFNRTLSPAEIKQWQDESKWEFVQDDAVLDSGLLGHYTSRVLVSQSYSPILPVNYSTGVDASAWVSGDLAAGPVPGGTGNYKTTVLVGQHYAGSQPELARYVNRVLVGQVSTSQTPAKYVTAVGVSQRTRGRPDGRVDLLGTARYRR